MLICGALFVVTIVDLNEMEVVRVEDHGVVPIPQESGAYEPYGRPTLAGLKPLEITQPDGPSFEVDGHGSAGRSGASG